MKRAWVIAVLVAACSKSQSFEDGMKVICNGDAVTKAAGDGPISGRMSKIAAWAKPQITNPDAQKVLDDLTAADGADRWSVLQQTLIAHKLMNHFSCTTMGYFAHRPFATDPRDDAARAFMLQLGAAQVTAWVGQPIDAKWLGADPNSDIRKIDCSDPGVTWTCKAPGDRFHNVEDFLLQQHAVVAVAVQFHLVKDGKYIRTGAIFWDDARAKSMGNPVQWLNSSESAALDHPSVTDAAAFAAQMPALAAFAERSVEALEPPVLDTPLIKGDAEGLAGRGAYELVEGQSINGNPSKLVGDADDAAKKWTVDDIQIQTLAAPDPSSDQAVHDHGGWVKGNISAAGGKAFIGPVWMATEAGEIIN